MAKQMTDLRIDEVSGVNRAANLSEGWLMLKSANGESLSEDEALLLARAEAISKGIDPDTITKGNTMPGLTDEVRESLPEDAQSYIKSLEDAVITSADTTTTSNETEEDRVAKALDALPEEVRSIVEKAQRESASASRVLKEMADREAEAKFTSVAKSLDSLPDTTTTALSKALREVSEKAPDSYEYLAKTLRAANAATSKSPLFKELGSGGEADANSDDPTTVMVAKANEIMSTAKSDEEMTFAKAMTRAASENPDIYARHRTATKQ